MKEETWKRSDRCYSAAADGPGSGRGGRIGGAEWI